MKIGIGNDHSALELKAEIIEFLKAKGHEVVDYGTNSTESCDFRFMGNLWQGLWQQARWIRES